MNKAILFFLLLSQIVFCQNIEIDGTVIDENKIPVAGAKIEVKDTNIETIADLDGNFTIEVPDSFNIISISYIGFFTKEIDAKTISNTKIAIVLEEDSSQLDEVFTVCRWYNHHIGISYYGGLNHSNLGFLFEYTEPSPLGLSIVPEIKFGFQTNLRNNTQTIGALNFKDLLRLSRKKFDLGFSFQEIELEDNFNWESKKIKLQTNFKTAFKAYTTFSLGLGISNLNSHKRTGITGGFEQYLFKGIKINSEITKWENLWQFQSGSSWSHKNLKIFYNFNSINTYSEHNIGIGYLINL